MTTKNFIGASFKAESEAGVGTAVFATLNTIDHDGDVTLPGAFGTQTAKLVDAHDWTAPNIGLAQIHEKGNEAVADFAFYLNMPSARERYESMRANFERGITDEWSYGFDILDSSFGEFQSQRVRFLKKLRVIEVSPVMKGAGIGTRTLALKDRKEATTLEDHFTGVIEPIGEFLERLEAIANLREKDGRTLSRRSLEYLSALDAKIHKLIGAAEPKDMQQIASELYGKFLHTRLRIEGRLKGGR